MKITKLEPVRVAIPFTHDGPQTGFAGQTWTKLEYLLVRLETDEGLTGWGEAFGYGSIPATQAALSTQVAPLVIGRRADDIASLMEDLKKTLHVFGRSGPIQFALSGLDIALWDLAGKQAGLPLHRLLGGGARESIPAYASKLRLTDPKQVADACEKAASLGFTGIKLHEITVECVAAARKAVGDELAIMLDVNCPWTPTQALEMGRRFKPYGLEWFEEPVWPPENHQALSDLHVKLGLPIAAGENCANAWSFQSLAATEGIDILQPSITKIGGVSEFVQVAMLAQLHGRQLVPHSPYCGPGYLATLQMAAVFPSTPWFEYLSVNLERPIFGDVGCVSSDGSIAIPNSPGLGADPDPEILKRYRVS